MLYAFLLKLRPLSGHPLLDTRGHQAHALFLRIIQSSDPELSRRLHDEQGRKPFTVAAGRDPRRNAADPSAGGSIWLRVTLLDDDLFGPFVARFLRPDGPPLRLGSALFTVDSILSTREDSPATGYSDFETLISGKHLSSTVGFTFGSPTAFSLGQLPNGKRRMQLLPDPALIFDSLLRKWNQFVKQPDLCLDPALRTRIEQYCVVSNHRLHVETFQFPRHTQAGFVGNCQVTLLDDAPDLIQSMHGLANFARYAGIGYKTTMGMGQAWPWYPGLRDDAQRAA